MNRGPARAASSDRAKVQTRITRLTRTAIVLAGGATACIGVAVAKEHPGASTPPANQPLPGPAPATTSSTNPTTVPTAPVPAPVPAPAPATTPAPGVSGVSPTPTTSIPTSTTTSPPTTTTTRPVVTSGATSRAHS